MIELDISQLEVELKLVFDLSSNFVIICLGNELRGNDEIGIYIGKKILQRLPSMLQDRIVLAYNTPVNFLGKIVKFHPDLVLVIDGIHGDFEEGKIVLLDSQGIRINENPSTHYQDLRQIQSYLENATQKLIAFKILGISIKSVNLLDTMSPEIVDKGEFIIDVLSKVIIELVV